MSWYAVFIFCFGWPVGAVGSSRIVAPVEDGSTGRTGERRRPLRAPPGARAREGFLSGGAGGFAPERRRARRAAPGPGGGGGVGAGGAGAFAHLHGPSEYSRRDGASRIKDLVSF